MIPVLTLLTRCLLLVAMLLMPFGMASAASSNAHQMSAAEMPMKHCPDTGGADHGGKPGIPTCAMACASALPAIDFATEHHRIADAARLAVFIAHPLQGFHPETLTPPPRLS